jgi:hypothetical protein
MCFVASGLPGIQEINILLTIPIILNSQISLSILLLLSIYFFIMIKEYVHMHPVISYYTFVVKYL